MTEQLQDDIGYRTLLCWLHEEGFRLKIPQPWPNEQGEEKRQAFIEELKTYWKDPEVEIWCLDETGIEGDPRPRRRWAQKGEKIRQPYEGTHIRMNVTGVVCLRTGEFYALILPHSDTEMFQAFLDQANQDIQFERKRNLLICDYASWHKHASLNWGRFEPKRRSNKRPENHPSRAEHMTQSWPRSICSCEPATFSKKPHSPPLGRGTRAAGSFSINVH